MINSSFFRLMKPSSYLINTARAALIHEKDLLIALTNNQIAGVAIDGFWEEPPRNHPIFAFDNALITPHMAWASHETRQYLIDCIAFTIKDYIENKPIISVNEV